MNTLKRIIIILLTNIIAAPCLLVLNERPDGEPQRWWINITGFAYIGILALVYKYSTKYRHS
jgi:hypothetical protein